MPSFVITLSSWALLCYWTALSFSWTALSFSWTAPTTTTTTTTLLSRSQAVTAVTEILFPAQEYGQRIALGRRAQGVFEDSSVVSAHDERLYQTYGEFPLSSLDCLLDRALLETKDSQNLTVVDVGSGCGRLVYYLGLSRANWRVHGIELSPLLHQEALVAQERAMNQGLLLTTTSPINSQQQQRRHSQISFHQGPAEEFGEILQAADIVFAYSTTWECQGFSEHTQTMILSDEWNRLFSRYCNGLVITTDRSLDPNWGWTILDRMEVPNPEVLGSTGYLHVCTNKPR